MDLPHAMKLMRSRKPVATIFDLLGTKEDHMTYALGYVASRSPRFLGALLRQATDATLDGLHEATIKLQAVTGDRRGRTDVEILLRRELHVVFEAKRGPWLPGHAQLQLYVDTVLNTKAATRRLVVVTNASQGHAESVLPGVIDGVPVKHLSWRTIQELAGRARRAESNRNKHLLNEFGVYLGGIIGMRNTTSNMVYVVSLGSGGAHGLNFIDVVNNRRRYFDLVRRYKSHLPNYLGFRYRSRLKSIHHVDGYETFTRASQVFSDGSTDELEPHYLFKLGPPIPSREVKAGPKIVRAMRVWCMLDTLLTCDTISDALEETHRRRQGTGEDVEESEPEATDEEDT
jgi:hypothetical protein